MATLNLDDVPQELIDRLRLAADSRHRQLNDEVIERLDDSFGPVRYGPRRPHSELLKLATKVRGEVAGTWLTPEFIRLAREYGRE